MRKVVAVAVFVMALAGLLVAPAIPAVLSNAEGQTCPAGTVGTWHFVNTQTGGAAAGTLTAEFSGGQFWTVGPSKVNPNNQHFIVESTGTLITAETNLPGRLVLSDFSCEDVKK
jgi:hypothetical protein